MVTVLPGSGCSGLNVIPRESLVGAASASVLLTNVSPINRSSAPSPSRSPAAGLDHVRCGRARAFAQSEFTPAEVPVPTSKANNLRPKATTNSLSPSPSMSIDSGALAAISSLSFPLLESMVCLNNSLGSPLTS